MASSKETMERFAHDVCVHALEKFGIFKAPDDLRKQNKYASHDFLPLISRSVVSFAIWIRAYFKNMLEDRCKVSELSDNDVIWIFEDCLLKSDKYSGLYWTEKVCLSLALCTEYVQFASTKDFRVSLNKLVIAWGECFERHLRKNFEENDGFLGLYNYTGTSQIKELDKFQEAFISDYCLPYGAIECTPELAKECMEKLGLNISLESTIFGIKTFGDHRESVSEKMEQVKLSNFAENEDPKPENTSSSSSDSEEDSSSSSIDSVVEASPNIDSEGSDSDISPNNLLGIPPHEDMLREIDPFFVENIPLPPKARSSSKSPEPKCGSNEVLQSDSETTENGKVSSEGSKSSLESHERELEANNVAKPTSKLPEPESDAGDVTKSSLESSEPKSDESNVTKSSLESSEPKSDESNVTKSSLESSEPKSDESNVTKSSLESSEPKSDESNVTKQSSLKSPETESYESNVLKSSLKSLEPESDESNVTKSSKSLESETGASSVTKSSSKSSERESNASQTTNSSKSPKSESSAVDAPKSLPKSPERESSSSDAQQTTKKSSELKSSSSGVDPQSSPEAELLKEKVDHILTRLENDMNELRNLLSEHGLLSTKTGRRGGNRLRVRDPKGKPPPGPEGLI